MLARLGVFLILFALFKAPGKARHVLEHPISLTLQLLLQGFQIQASHQHMDHGYLCAAHALVDFGMMTNLSVF